MLDPRSFRLEVIRPVLEHLGLWSLSAERLLLGTALVESNLSAIVQHGGGPALSVYQLEPATIRDGWTNFLAFKPKLAQSVLALELTGLDRIGQVAGNLYLATAHARIRYYRARPPLPGPEDQDGLGAYWKAHYNTPLGKGRPAEFVRRLSPIWSTPALRD